jgi:hypothetical protein
MLIYFLYEDEYRIFKPVEITVRRRNSKVERRRIEEKNQFRF